MGDGRGAGDLSDGAVKLELEYSEGGRTRTHDLGIKRTLTSSARSPRPKARRSGCTVMYRDVVASMVQRMVQSKPEHFPTRPPEEVHRLSAGRVALWGAQRLWEAL
jgi:hypothetical protein